MQQVLVGSAKLWEIFLTGKICLEKQIVRCSLPRKVRKHIFLSACLVESFLIGPERKHKIDFFASFCMTRPFSKNYSISKFIFLEKFSPSIVS